MAPAATAARVKAATTPAKNKATPATDLLERHGADAPIHAAMRADRLLEVGDLDGYAVLKRVVLATEELVRTKRSPNEQAH